MRKVVVAYHSVGSPAGGAQSQVGADGDQASKPVSSGPGKSPCPAVIGSFPVSMDRFIAQIEGIRRKGWRIGRLSELLDPVDGETAYIVGDDGTVDWARNVLPWCEEHSIPTQTGVITGVWRDEPIYPIAHKVQVLLAVRRSEELPRPTLNPEQIAYADKVYFYETDPARRYLKGACNIFFDYEQANEFLGTLDFDCLKLLAARFARPNEYNRFKLAEIGVHTVCHGPYGGDAEGYFRTEVYPCLQTLLKNCDNVGRFFTLPVKPKNGVSLEPLNDILRRHGFQGLMSYAGEWDRRSFVITRIDAKDVEQFFGLAEWKEGS